MAMKWRITPRVSYLGSPTLVEALKNVTGMSLVGLQNMRSKGESTGFEIKVFLAKQKKQNRRNGSGVV